MAKSKLFFGYRTFSLLLIVGIIISSLLTASLARQYFASKEISVNWKTYQGKLYPFKVKVPQDAKYYESPSDLEGSNDGHASFSGNGYQIRMDIWTNDRSDKTLKDLMATRDFNGITNVGMPICCSNGNMILLPNGNKAVIEDSFLQNGGKFGIQAMLLGKKYYYIISSGSLYQPNFSYREEKIFMEFLNTFQIGE